jgi:hypothetical protein
VLRQAHPKAPTPEHEAVFGFVTGNVGHEQTVDGGRITRPAWPWAEGDGVPKMIEGYLRAQRAKTPRETFLEDAASTTGARLRADVEALRALLD